MMSEFSFAVTTGHTGYLYRHTDRTLLLGDTDNQNAKNSLPTLGILNVSFVSLWPMAMGGCVSS